MQQELIGPVYAVIGKALDLKERLERTPELVSFEKEQGNLKELVRKVPNLGEDRSDHEDLFLGIRYPLICWLDEVFILNSRWKTEWTEFSLEMSLYDSRDRAWKFWEQAQMAESKVSADAVEVFFLCAMLGFRGDWYNKPEKLQLWHKATRSLLLDQRRGRWSGPDEVKPPTFVPPLIGLNRKKGMLLAWAASSLILIPVGVVLLIAQLG